MDTLAKCDEDIFSSINRYLTVLQNIYTIANTENIDEINHIGDIRLTRLALLNIHCDINIDVTKVIDRFLKPKHN